MMTVPPRVGVPRLVWWASGRSTWMSWPRPHRRKVRMASGVPTRPAASATAAAIRMPTTPLGPFCPGGYRSAASILRAPRTPRVAPGAEQPLGHHLEADHPAGLDQDDVGGAQGGAEQRDRGVGVGGGVGLLPPHALPA